MKKILLVICMVLLVPLMLINVIAVGLNDYYTVSVIKPIEYCMCDNDCIENQGCLSDDSGWILSLITTGDDYITEAHSNEYNGVCARLLFQTHETPYSMTEDCSPQFLPEVVNLTDPEEEELEVVEEEPEPDNATTAEAEEAKTAEAEKAKTAEAESQENEITGQVTQENSNQEIEEKPTEGEETMVPTIYIISATTVIMGFFILIGWLSYLLYRK